MEKLKAGVTNHMARVELEAWTSFIPVVKHFLGNTYSEKVAKILANVKKTGGKYEYQIILFVFSDDQEERFHQDIKTTEERRKGSRIAV